MKKLSKIIWLLVIIFWIDMLFFDNNIIKNYNSFKYKTELYFKYGTYKDIYIDNNGNKIELSDIYDDVICEIYPDENLPKIPVKFTNLDYYNASGLYSYSGINRIIYIDDKVRKRDLNGLKDVLAHEIIHYYLEYYEISDSHDDFFLFEMLRINLLYDYNISITDNYNYDK